MPSRLAPAKHTEATGPCIEDDGKMNDCIEISVTVSVADEEINRKLLRKIDMQLMPVVSCHRPI